MAHVYLLRCADGTFYVGSTRNLTHRLEQHTSGLGSTYTSTRQPVELVWSHETPDIGDAYRLERQLHGWSRAKKEALIRGDFALIRAAARRRGGRARQ